MQMIGGLKGFGRKMSTSLKDVVNSSNDMLALIITVVTLSITIGLGSYILTQLNKSAGLGVTNYIAANSSLFNVVILLLIVALVVFAVVIIIKLLTGAMGGVGAK